jgi:cytochrome c-type biogenesis protein CcmH/NrfG
MPKPTKKQLDLNNNLTGLLAAVCVITTLLLTSHNLNLYLSGFKQEIKAQTRVLGAKDNSNLLTERSFWLNHLSSHPSYFPGWLELAKIEKKLGNIGKSNYALIKAHEINPNSEELKSLFED